MHIRFEPLVKNARFTLVDRDGNAPSTSTWPLPVDEIQRVSEKQLSPDTNELNDTNTMTKRAQNFTYKLNLNKK